MEVSPLPSPRDWKTLPDPPPVPGLHFRHFRGEDDIPAIVEVVRAQDEANRHVAHTTVDRERFALEHMTNLKPREDVVLALVNDRVVAVARADWFETMQGDRFYRSLGHVHPDWRRHGLANAMFSRNEQRLRAIARSHGTTGSQRLVTWFSDEDAGARALAERHGFEQDRTYWYMYKPRLDDVVVPPLPDGIEVRPISREQLPGLWTVMKEAFRDHGGQFDWGSQAWERWSQDPRLDLDLCVFMFEGDEIVGGGQAMIDHEENEANGYQRGWLERGFIRRQWRSVRRRGLAAGIFPRVLTSLRDKGMTAAQLRVDASNPFNVARAYRKYGFETVTTSSEWHKSIDD